MNSKMITIAFLALGAAWGLLEIFGKQLVADLGFSRTSLWLAILAVLILSIARGLWHRLGSSSLLGLMAAGIKFAGPSTNYCHLLGIASLGIFFDLLISIMARGQRPQPWRLAAAGALTIYGARTFFVLYTQQVAQLSRWVDGGLAMALDHIIYSGGIVAIAAVFLTPIGFGLGAKLGQSTSSDLDPAIDQIIEPDPKAP